MTSLNDPGSLAGKLDGTGSVVAIANTGQVSLLSLVYKLKGADIQIAAKPLDAEGHHFGAGSLFINNAPADQVKSALHDLALDGANLSTLPQGLMRAMPPRIAMMHTWLATQTEGWWRYAFDTEGIPFDYISTQTAAKEDDLRSKYDVIIFAPVSRVSATDILNGYPSWNNALPWEKTDLTPNLGNTDTTPDMRPGLGYEGLAHLRKFVEQGGLLITCEDTAQFVIDMGLAPGVSIAQHGDARVVGSVLDALFVNSDNPVAFGYGKSVPVISSGGMAFNVSNTLARDGGRLLMDPYAERPTGRGTVEDSDEPQGRKIAEAETLEKQQPWQARKLNEEQTRNNPLVIPENLRPEVILRFADNKSLLLDGLLDKAGSIAEHAIVVDAHLGEGNVLLFGNNPIYRGETIGTYGLVFNAILNHDRLAHPVAAKQ
jgi:hypothetical protein